MTDHTDWTLLEIVAFCFEKNEVFDGWAPRDVPYRSEELARVAFDKLTHQAQRLLGPPAEAQRPTDEEAICVWPGSLRLTQSRRRICVEIAVDFKRSPRILWGDDPDWKGSHD